MHHSRTNEHANNKDSSSSRWNRIIILDQNKDPIPDQIYYLDNKAKLLTKLKRQKRRDLGKVTGKKKVPRNWKQIIENLNDTNITANDYLKEPITIPCESNNSSLLLSFPDQESQQIESLSFDKLISIDWLLNTPTEIDEIV